MTKEWQEATNEYLKVIDSPVLSFGWILITYRKKVPTLSTVLAARVTVERVMCRASLRRLKVSLLNRMNRCLNYNDDCTSHTKFLQLGVFFRKLGLCMSYVIALLTPHVQNLSLIPIENFLCKLLRIQILWSGLVVASLESCGDDDVGMIQVTKFMDAHARSKGKQEGIMWLPWASQYSLVYELVYGNIRNDV